MAHHPPEVGIVSRGRPPIRLRPHAADLAALLLVTCSIAANRWVSMRVFEALPHLEDEFANLWQAEVMAQGRTALPSPAEPRSFLVPFVVDFGGQRLAKYPPGWPAALSLGARLGGEAWVNPILAGLCVWLIYRLGSRIAGPGVGLLGAFLGALSPSLLMLGGSLMSHLFSLFLTLALFLAWMDLFEPAGRQAAVPRGVLLAVAGGALGLLALTRPLTMLGVALPLTIHALVLVRRGPTQRGSLLTIAGLAVAVGLLLPVWNLVHMGDALANPYALWWPYDRVGFGADIGRAPGGHNLRMAYWNARFSLQAGQHDLFGWPYLSWIFVPFGLFALRRKTAAWLAGGVLLGLVGVYTLYWVGSWLYGPRYYFEALPGLSLLSAAGIAWLAGGNPHRSNPRHRWRAYAVSGLVTCLLLGNVAFYLPARLGGLHGLYGISRDALQAFERGAPDRGLIFIHPARSWTEYGTLLMRTPPFCRCGTVLAYSRGALQDRRAAEAHPDLPVFHYYGDEPGVFYALPRTR